MSDQSKSFTTYSLAEDVLSAVSHGIGTVLAIAGLVFLIQRRAANADGYQIVTGSIFGASLIFSYLSSTLYHSLRIASVRLLFRKLDHSAIYVLIAGTYTAMMPGVLRGGWGWSFFGIAWAIALSGILLKVFCMGKYPRLSLATYLIMGWLCVIGIYPLWKHLPRESFYLLLAGGLIYSLGAILYALKKIPYTHAIWHLFVLGGSIAHYFCIYTAFCG
jgi:hemolysin III